MMPALASRDSDSASRDLELRGRFGAARTPRNEHAARFDVQRSRIDKLRQ